MGRDWTTAGSKMAQALTERTDLKSGKAGWHAAVKGTQKRVDMKLGPRP